MTTALGARMVLAVAVAVMVLLAGVSVSGAPLAATAEALATRISARLKVVAGDNATCPWKVSLLDAQGFDGGRQLCTQELGVSLAGSPTIADVSTPASYTNSTTELPLLVGTQSSTSSAPETTLSVKAGTPEQGVAGPPPEGYVRVGAHGLYKLHHVQRQWPEARATCEREGAHLVVLDSASEARALRRFLADSSPDADHDTLHAGFRLDLRTLQGERIAYESWPRSEDSTEFCGRIDTDIWLLYGSCLQRKSFICEYEHQTNKRVTETASPTPTPAPAPETPAACGNTKREFLTGRGYAPLDGWNGTYVKNMGPTSDWNSAKETCEKDGAQLVIMESETNADALFAFIESSGINNFFLGVRTGDPVTVQGEPLLNKGYQRWAKKNQEESCFSSSRNLLYYTCECRLPEARHHQRHYSSHASLVFHNICQVNVN